MFIIACYFIAETLLLWPPRDIVQIAYHLRQKSPLHFATSHNTLQQSQLHTLCQKTHNFRSWQSIDHVKMLYVNLRNLCHCCYFFLFFVLISAVLFVQCFLSYYDENYILCLHDVPMSR